MPKRFHHYHVRKTAGTSLNAAFWALGGVDLQSFGAAQRKESRGLVFVRHEAALIQAGEYFFSNAHIPAYQLVLPPETFTITILRDPLARIYSYYRYLCWARGETKEGSEEPFLDSLQREVPWLGSCFSDFLARVPRCHLLHQLHMFSATYDVNEAVERVEACDAVCLTETYASDLAELAYRTGLALEERQERRVGDRPAVTNAEWEMARQLLAPEFQLLKKLRRSRRCVLVSSALSTPSLF